MDPHRSRQNVNNIILRKLPGLHGRGTVACTEYIRGTSAEADFFSYT